MELGGKIRAIRKNQGLSQAEVERRTGIKREYLSKLENNELKNPTFNTLKKIAEGLGVSVTYLLDYSDCPAKDFREKQDKIKKEIKLLEAEISKMEIEFKYYLKTLEQFKQKRLLYLSQLITTGTPHE